MRISRQVAQVVFLVCSVPTLGQIGSINPPTAPNATKSEHASERDNSCRENSLTFPLLLPSEIPASQGQEFQRADIRFDSATEIVVSQLRSPTTAGALNSTIAIRTKGENPGQETFPLSQLIRRGEGLWLFQAKTICGKLGQKELILGFMLGAVGAGQGFVVVDRSAGHVRIRAFPNVVEHGKLVMHREELGRAELWGATEFGSCEACKKHYQVEDCELGVVEVVCTKQAKLRGPFAPNAITASLIDIR